MVPEGGGGVSPVKIHKIDKIERLKDRSISPLVRFSTVGRSDIRFPLKDNLIPRGFPELIYIFVCSALDDRAEKFCFGQ